MRRPAARVSTPPIRPQREGPRALEARAAEARPHSRLATARCRDRTGKDRKKPAELPPFFREPSGRAAPPVRSIVATGGGLVSLFITKSVDALTASAEGEGKLKRVLGPIDLTTLGIGAIIGTGIFVLTGQAAAAHAGPAIVLSMILAGVVSALAALCYAEFASTVPIAGSAYTYGYATLGEFVAWIIGWDLILEYALGAATVAVGWSGYVVSLLVDLGVRFPPLLSAAPGTPVVLADGSAATAIFNLPAIAIAVAVTVLLVIGIRESARVNAAIVAIKVAVVLLIIGVGGMFVSAEYWRPFVPENA